MTTKKASGDWTVVAVGPPHRLQSYIKFADGSTSGVMSVGAAVATKDAHNAALAAEFQRGYESTVGWKIAEERLVEVRELEAQLAAERDRYERLQAGYQQLAREHEKTANQLAAERESKMPIGAFMENQQLREQLAAERERTKLLVDTLEKMPEVAYKAIIEGAGVSVENLPNELQCIADAALAQVKEGK